MKYWFLKNGDVVGPLSVEEIKKDEFFADDCLVCPEDKAEEADFWKTPQNYAQDFFPVVEDKKPNPRNTETSQNQEQAPLQNPEDTQSEAEMEIPEEVSLDDALQEGIEQMNSDESISQEPILPPNNETEKNPFESDRPQIAPNIEDTISNHVIAPRLDAEGDTLLEDIPAKAILSDDNEKEEDKFDAFSAPSSLSEEDSLDDTPILNIFERPEKEINRTKEIADISEHIYDTYGAAERAKERATREIKENASQTEDIMDTPPSKEDIRKKNNKIFLLVLLMFILVGVALLLALLSPSSDEKETQQNQQETQTAALPVKTQASPLQSTEARDILDTPTTDASAFFASQNDNAEQDRAIAKVKKFILSNGNSLGDYLSSRYADYQTSWVADVLSGRNYYVHFSANKIRQEPIVYSFSIDLDKNEIAGLNNLGMDILKGVVKGE